MMGQDPRSEGKYRFSGSVKKGTAKMDPTDRKVSRDINKRDRADIKEVEDKAAQKKPLSKQDKMKYKDAVERQNRLGAAYGNADRSETGKGYSVKEGEERTKRLKKLYKNSSHN